MELQALGSVTARVRLMGRPSGTLPVRMRQAQLVLAFTTPARDRQQSAVGDDPPPLVLLVMYPRHGVKLVMSDAVHDVATACPDTGAGGKMANNSSAADARASSLESIDLCLSVTCPCSCFLEGSVWIGQVGMHR
jgi:hypothetical protein